MNDPSTNTLFDYLYSKEYKPKTTPANREITTYNELNKKLNQGAPESTDPQANQKFNHNDYLMYLIAKGESGVKLPQGYINDNIDKIRPFDQPTVLLATRAPTSARVVSQAITPQTKEEKKTSNGVKNQVLSQYELFRWYQFAKTVGADGSSIIAGVIDTIASMIGIVIVAVSNNDTAVGAAAALVTQSYFDESAKMSVWTGVLASQILRTMRRFLVVNLQVTDGSSMVAANKVLPDWIGFFLTNAAYSDIIVTPTFDFVYGRQHDTKEHYSMLFEIAKVGYALDSEKTLKQMCGLLDLDKNSMLNMKDMNDQEQQKKTFRNHFQYINF